MKKTREHVLGRKSCESRGCRLVWGCERGRQPLGLCGHSPLMVNLGAKLVGMDPEDKAQRLQLPPCSHADAWERGPAPPLGQAAALAGAEVCSERGEGRSGRD